MRSSSSRRWMLSAKYGLTIITKPMPMLKTRNISASSTPPSCCSQPKTGGMGQLPLRRKTRRPGARDVALQSFARDMGQATHDAAFDRVVLKDVFDRPNIDARRLEQFVS